MEYSFFPVPFAETFRHTCGDTFDTRRDYDDAVLSDTENFRRSEYSVSAMVWVCNISFHSNMHNKLIFLTLFLY